MLYPWRRNLFLKDTEGSELLVKMRVGKEVSREAMPYEGRVDILVSAAAEVEAKWLRIVTMEIDYVSVPALSLLGHIAYSSLSLSLLSPPPPPHLPSLSPLTPTQLPSLPLPPPPAARTHVPWSPGGGTHGAAG